MLFGRLGASYGRLGGGPGEPGEGIQRPTAPVLTWASDETDDTPEFTIEIDDTVAEGDSYQFQVQADGGDWSSLEVDQTDTITSGEDTANQIDLPLAAMDDGAYEARVRVATAEAPSAWSDWSNVVDFTIDATAPTAQSFSPADNATDVAADTDLVVTFSEPIVLGASGTITLKLTSDDSTIDSWDVSADEGSGAGQLEVLNTDELHLHLTTDLSAGSEFYVIWDAGVVEDAVGNPVAAQASTTAWSFTTTSSDVSVSLQGSGITTHLGSNLYEVADLSIGDESASRRVIAAVVGWGIVTGRNISSATIGGVSATVHDTNSGGINEEVLFISAVVPTGTTADVQLQFSSNLGAAPYVVLYTCDDDLVVNASPTTQAVETSGATSLSPSLATESGGFVIVAVTFANGSGKGTITCTGDETYTLDYSLTAQIRVWHTNNVAADASNAISVAWTGSFSAASRALTWR